MKKITRLLLLAAISIGMVACSNDDVPQTPESLRGSTYASIAVTLPKAPSTRTLPDDYNKIGTWEGIDAIETITVFLVNKTLGTIDHSTFGTSQFETIDGNGVLKPNLAVKATPGEEVKAYVVLNGNTNVLDILKGTTPGAFDGVYNAVISEVASKLAKNIKIEEVNKDVIMMTNTVLPTAIPIEANVDEATAKAGTSNSVKVEVERVVSRAIATVAATAKSTVIPVKDANNVEISEITIKDLKYVVGQSNKEFYMIKQEGYKTPKTVYGFVPTADNWMDAVKGDEAIFDNTGLTSLTEVKTATGGTSITQFQDALTGEGEASKFVLPVTHLDDNYRKGNTTFFEVIAIFTPNLVDSAEYTPGTDVFLGMNDGKFYKTRELAEVSGQKATHYKGDKTAGGAIMKYVLWLNPNEIPGTAGSKATKSPTVRNQVYHAHIKGFKSIGVPNNPLNPDDPNDPLNPKNPIDPSDPLETEDTYLSVEITVLKWGVHSYEIDLGNDY